MTTIYRKYRPQTFAEVTDQEHIATTLQNEIILGTIAHAYLFSGPRGVGKTTTARLLAKAINCPERKKGSAEPCNECTSCQEIGALRHIDVIEIDAASQTGVDNVRENIIENAFFKPTKAPYKVFVIDEVHMLSTSAFNALLKTLEEPPAHVVFILATTELHKLPATVISRCQRFHFKKISYEKMLERLTTICQSEKVSVAKDVLDRIIAKSDGGLRDAESLLGQIFSLNLKKVTAEDAELMLPTANSEAVLSLLEKISTNDAKGAVEIIHQQVEEGMAIDQLLHHTIELLRAMLVIGATGSTAGEAADFSDSMLKKIKALAEAMTLPKIIALLDIALKRRLESKTTPLPQLPLELLTVEGALLFSAAAPVAIPLPTAEKKTLHEKSEPKMTLNQAPPVKIEAASAATSSVISTTMDQIKKRWPEIMDQVAQSAHSLNLVLKTASLHNLAGNCLYLAVPYSFHKEKLEELKNRRLIEQSLEKCFGEKMLIACEVVAAESATTENSISSLALAFGGEVVE